MKRMMGCAVVALILIAIVGGILVWGVGINNDLVRKQLAVDAGWAQVENVYQRRADLIPNLVETVKGAANFKKERCRRSSTPAPKPRRWSSALKS